MMKNKNVNVVVKIVTALKKIIVVVIVHQFPHIIQTGGQTGGYHCPRHASVQIKSHLFDDNTRA